VPQLVLLPFGAVKGDKVSYRVDCPHGFGGAVLGIRYRTCKAGGGDCVFRSEGLFDGEMRFAPSDGLGVAFFPVGKITPGPAGLTLTAEGGGDGIELDCLFITEGSQSSGVSFTTVPYGRVPEISDSGSAKLYRYPGVGTVYGLAPLADRVRCRAIPTGSLEDAMISRLSNPDPTFDDVCEPFTALVFAQAYKRGLLSQHDNPFHIYKAGRDAYRIRRRVCRQPSKSRKRRVRGAVRCAQSARIPWLYG
jgi:hypothetical protein